MEQQIHLLSLIIVVVAGIIPFFLSFKLKHPIRKLTIVLSLFIIVHGTYHFFESVSNELGDLILEPLSVVILIIFGIIYLKNSSKKKEVKV